MRRRSQGVPFWNEAERETRNQQGSREIGEPFLAGDGFRQCQGLVRLVLFWSLPMFQPRGKVR